MWPSILMTWFGCGVCFEVILKCFEGKPTYGSIDLLHEYTSSKSHNALFCNKNVCTCMHISITILCIFGIFVRYIVGFTRLVHRACRVTDFILFSEIGSMVGIGICCSWCDSLHFGWFTTHPPSNPKCHSHQDRVLLCEFLEFNDSENILSLTHWGRHKMAVILQMALPMHLPEWKCLNWDKHFTEVCSYTLN